MCLYVGSDVILANLLSKKDGVSKKEIVSYCKKLSDTFNDNQINNVYIDVNDYEIEHALSKYNREFRFFQGRYSINEKINLKHFNARYDDSVVSSFEEVAQTI